MKIALIGYGKMGCELEKMISQMGHSISFIAKDSSWTPQDLCGADTAIEFTSPDAVLKNIEKALSAKIPLVVGTTGWYDQLADVQHLVEKNSGTLLYSPNFSLGVNLFLKIVRHAATLINRFDHYDVGGYEIHHNQKKDSPSGTANAICRELLAALDRKTGVQHTSFEGTPDQQILHFPSLRVGHVPGTHTVIADAQEETITLTHEARSRSCFARGAILAADWLQNKKGFFHFDDLFKEF